MSTILNLLAELRSENKYKFSQIQTIMKKKPLCNFKKDYEINKMSEKNILIFEEILDDLSYNIFTHSPKTKLVVNDKTLPIINNSSQ